MADPSALPSPSAGAGATRPVLLSRPASGERSRSLGRAHYSYGFAADNFIRMFEDRNIAVEALKHPEQFKGPLYGARIGLGAGEHLHLVFRSTEDIRPIAGAYNVACFAWEFDRLKNDGLPEESVLDDQVRMLRSCDEIWTPCTYTQRVLSAHGLERAHVIPAPIAQVADGRGDASLEPLGFLASVPLVTRSSGDEEAFRRLAKLHVAPLKERERLAAAIAAKRLFLTVCNPYDKRKNLATVIEGFLMATRGMDDAVLLVKLVTSGQFELPAGYLYHQMRVLFGNPHCLHEESVVLFSSFLSDEQMSALYNLADFYLGAPLAEGQNLPLLEAMAHGCVPVFVRNTAMADYISEDNAVVIAEGRYQGLVSGLASDVARSRIAVDFADRFQVADAVRAAIGLSAEQRRAKGEQARATVRRQFSDEHVFTLIQERLAQVRPGVVPQPSDTPPTRLPVTAETESGGEQGERRPKQRLWG